MIDLHGYGPRFLAGMLTTAELALASLALAFSLGLVLASARLSRSRTIYALATGYINFVRGVPPLVMLMLGYYGGQVLLNQLLRNINPLLGVDWFINIQPLAAGIIIIGMIYAAYMSETFRGAFLAVDAGQMEAAQAFGMSGRLAFRRIRFPLMMRHALPGLSNNWMVLLKATALVSIIGLSGMVHVADQGVRDTHQPFLFLLPVAAVYLLMTTVSELIIAGLQRRFEIGVKSVH
ncbi:ABC transporter permease [Salinisphaera orenii]|uniref:ABC transporter permease n=1 Tax=Salinisphaera orenii TaxID=856731 RepID=UPI000DBE90D5